MSPSDTQSVYLVGGPCSGARVPRSTDSILLTGTGVPEGMVARYRYQAKIGQYSFEGYDKVVATVPRSEAKARGLGYTQRLVLRLLALGSRPKSIRDLAYDWPGLTEGAARGAVSRLGDRSLVDLADFDPSYNSRRYALTAKGQRVVDALDADEFESEDDDA